MKDWIVRDIVDDDMGFFVNARVTDFLRRYADAGHGSNGAGYGADGENIDLRLGHGWGAGDSNGEYFYISTQNSGCSGYSGGCARYAVTYMGIDAATL